MKIIILDLDTIKLPLKIKKYLNYKKICTLTVRDFGKKTLLCLPKRDPRVLMATLKYRDAIFKTKDDQQELRHEDRMFRQIKGRIRWFRVGVLLRREKACKILLKLLGR